MLFYKKRRLMPTTNYHYAMLISVHVMEYYLVSVKSVVFASYHMCISGVIVMFNMLVGSQNVRQA